MRAQLLHSHRDLSHRLSKRAQVSPFVLILWFGRAQAPSQPSAQQHRPRDTSQSVGGTNIPKRERYFWAMALPSPSKAVKNAPILEEGGRGRAKSVQLPHAGQHEVKAWQRLNVPSPGPAPSSMKQYSICILRSIQIQPAWLAQAWLHAVTEVWFVLCNSISMDIWCCWSLLRRATALR